MAKQVSLKKVWHLCNLCLQTNFAIQADTSKALEAYKLLNKSHDPLSKTLINEFGQNIEPQLFEAVCIKIENLINLPIKDGDFIIASKDKKSSAHKKSELIFFLHNIRSGFNIGSMVRLADGFYINKVILSGYTAGPNNSQVLRASLGAESNIIIEQDDHNMSLLLKYKTEGYTVVALETVVGSQSLFNFNFPQKTLLIVGNERKGLSQTELQLADKVIHIPMFGVKNSLNVTSALSIASYEWSKQWR